MIDAQAHVEDLTLSLDIICRAGRETAIARDILIVERFTFPDRLLIRWNAATQGADHGERWPRLVAVPLIAELDRLARNAPSAVRAGK